MRRIRVYVTADRSAVVFSYTDEEDKGICDSG